MSVIRVNKTKDYTVMSNYHLRDNNLSLKAKGLLSQMLSLPEDWDYTVKGLCAINKENETAINSTLKELKEAGYLIVTKKMPDKTATGRIEYTYDIYESPKQEGKKQDLENLGVEFQGVENQGQLNTDIQNKEKQNKEKNNNRFVPPTVDEIERFCKERNNGVDAKRVFDYYNSANWKDGRGNQVKNWKQKIIAVWERSAEKPANRIGQVAHSVQEYDENMDMEAYLEERRRRGV